MMTLLVTTLLLWTLPVWADDLPVPTPSLAVAPGTPTVLTWQDNSNNETGFVMERRVDPATMWQVLPAMIAANATTWTDPELFTARICYRIKAVNAVSASGYSNEACKAAVVEPPPPSTDPILTVLIGGLGRMTSAPPGIACPPLAGCKAAFPAGTAVTLTATPDPGSVLNSWGSTCAGNPTTCTVTITTSRNVAVSFIKPVVPPSPVDCVLSAWSAWSEWVLTGTTETRIRTRTILTSPANGGAACGDLLESENREIAPLPPDLFTLTTAVIGQGAVFPAGGQFTNGSSVSLTATPVTGWKFMGWTGACVGTTPCVITMNAAQKVTAVFARIPPVVPALPLATLDAVWPLSEDAIEIRIQRRRVGVGWCYTSQYMAGTTLSAKSKEICTP